MEEEQYKDGQELVKKKQQERQARKGQKQQSFLKSMSRFLSTVAIIAGVGYVLTLRGWYLPKDTFKTFNPKRIQVVDNKIVKTDKIKSVIKDVPVLRIPIFLSNEAVLKKKLMELSPVKSVYIRRFAFPARIVIFIREATPIISISPDANVRPVAAYTKEGRLIMGAEYLPLPPEYKTLLVLSYGNKGDDYRKWDMKRVKEIQNVARYIETYTKEPVEYVDVRNPDDIFVKVKSFAIRLGRNDDTLEERIKRIPSILPEAEKVKTKVDYIDVRWEDVNYLKMKG